MSKFGNFIERLLTFKFGKTIRARNQKSKSSGNESITTKNPILSSTRLPGGSCICFFLFVEVSHREILNNLESDLCQKKLRDSEVITGLPGV